MEEICRECRGMSSNSASAASGGGSFIDEIHKDILKLFERVDQSSYFDIKEYLSNYISIKSGINKHEIILDIPTTARSLLRMIEYKITKAFEPILDKFKYAAENATMVDDLNTMLKTLPGPSTAPHVTSAIAQPKTSEGAGVRGTTFGSKENTAIYEYVRYATHSFLKSLGIEDQLALYDAIVLATTFADMCTDPDRETREAPCPTLGKLTANMVEYAPIIARLWGENFLRDNPDRTSENLSTYESIIALQDKFIAYLGGAPELEDDAVRFIVEDDDYREEGEILGTYEFNVTSTIVGEEAQGRSTVTEGARNTEIALRPTRERVLTYKGSTFAASVNEAKFRRALGGIRRQPILLSTVEVALDEGIIIDADGFTHIQQSEEQRLQQLFLSTKDCVKDASKAFPDLPAMVSHKAFLDATISLCGFPNPVWLPDLTGGIVLPYADNKDIGRDATLPSEYKPFWGILNILQCITDCADAGKIELASLFTIAALWDSAPERAKRSTIAIAPINIDLQEHGIVDIPCILNVGVTGEAGATRTVTFQFTTNGIVEDPTIFEVASTGEYICRAGGEFIEGNHSNAAAFARGISEEEALRRVRNKLVMDTLKALIAKTYGNNTILLTHDKNLAIRCILLGQSVILKRKTKAGGKTYEIFLNAHHQGLYHTREGAKTVAKVSTAVSRRIGAGGGGGGGSGGANSASSSGGGGTSKSFTPEGGRRRSRSRRRTQRGGENSTNIIFTAYIAFHFAVIKNYCTILNEYLKINDSADVRRILEFLQSEPYKVAVNSINTSQSSKSFLKELASYVPNQVIYRPSSMKTIFDKDSSSDSYEVHNLRVVFPMQGDQVLGSFQNRFTERDFTPILMNDNPRFLNILETLADKHPIAKKLFEKGGVTPQDGESFIEMLSVVESKHEDIDVPNILKAIFKELIPDPVQASSAHSLFVTYVMFHGYFVLNYKVVQRFIERINANGGLLPGGFDEMKEIVEGNSKAEPVIQEIYTPIKDPKLEELLNKTKASRAVISTEEELSPIAEPEFQPPMIAAGAAGGRRTRRRGRRGHKKRKTRRLTKKERNS